jgi:hypothetical protein
MFWKCKFLYYGWDFSNFKVSDYFSNTLRSTTKLLNRANKRWPISCGSNEYWLNIVVSLLIIFGCMLISNPLHLHRPLGIENTRIEMPFTHQIIKIIIYIFFGYQFKGGIERKFVCYFLVYEHALHIQFIWLNKWQK